MSVRKDIASAIKADNPTFTVKAHPVSSPDTIPANKPWVSVYRERFVVADNNGHIDHHMVVLIATPKKDSEAAEDELETAVDAVMLSLEKLDDVFWQEAKRLIIGTSEGYEVTLIARRPQVYKTQSLALKGS